MKDLQKVERLRKKFEERVGPYKGVFTNFFDELWDACEKDIGYEWDEDGTDSDDDEFYDQVAFQFIWKLEILAGALKQLK